MPPKTIRPKKPVPNLSPFAPKKLVDERRVRFFAVDGVRAYVLLDDGTCQTATPATPNWTRGPFPPCPWFPQLPGGKS